MTTYNIFEEMRVSEKLPPIVLAAAVLRLVRAKSLTFSRFRQSNARELLHRGYDAGNTELPSRQRLRRTVRPQSLERSNRPYCTDERQRSMLAFNG